MWHDINLKNVDKIQKCVGEYQVWIHNILPYGKMKIKIYEEQDKSFKGYTDVCIKKKYDGTPECAVGFGGTIEETLKDTIQYFTKIANEDYPNGLSDDDIEYIEYTDF